MAKTNQTVQQHANGMIVIHLGTGNGTVNAPRGVDYETCVDVACRQFPFGSHSRKANIIAKLRELAGAQGEE